MRIALTLALILSSSLALAARTEDDKIEVAEITRLQHLGTGIAMNGDTMLIGSDANATYVFVRSGNSWTQEAKLTASDGVPGDGFSYALGVDGDIAIVGARNAGPSQSGAAYIYVRSGGQWTEEKKLTPSDPTSFGYFGRAVAISGNTVVVGVYNTSWGTTLGEGAAYVFVRSAGVWTQEAKLLPVLSAELAEFGYAVAIQGDTILVASPRNDETVGDDAGGIHVYRRSGTTWTEETMFVPADLGAIDWFGRSVALDGDIALVGARLHNDSGVRSGAAYVFRNDGALWVEEAELLADDGADNDWFGEDVALEDKTAIIGALNHDAGWPDAGAAYRFVGCGKTWTQVDKLIASDPGDHDFLGARVAISGPTVAATAQRHWGRAEQTGAVYLYDLGASPDPCVPCAAGSIPEIMPLFATRGANRDDVQFVWLAELFAEAYNVWYVERKTDIPLASQAGAPAPAMAIPNCALVTPAGCTHPAGAPASAGRRLFYNVLGTCDDGTEAPK